MKIEFKVPDDDDGFVVACVDWPFVPQRGTSLIFENLVSCAERVKAQADPSYEVAVEPFTEFIVDEVVITIDCKGDPSPYRSWKKLNDDGISIPEITVWLRLPKTEAWKGAIDNG